MIKMRFAPENQFFYDLSEGPFREDGVVRRSSSHHVHNRIELYFLEEGACSYFIGDRSYTVESGDLVIIPKGTIHRTIYEKGTRKRVVINCTSKYIPAAVMPKLTPVIPLYRNKETVAAIKAILDGIGADYAVHDEYSDDSILARMHVLFYLIARSIATAEGVVPRKLSAERIINYVGKHYPEDISLASVAKEFSLSPEYLSRLFKKECGFGFSEYLTATRLSAARDMLLKHPEMKIAEAAFSCGYSDSNYFSTCFRREYGASPKNFRTEKGGGL